MTHNAPHRISICTAAKQVLKEAGTPLHATEILNRILSQGLWQTEGKTPVATLGARLYSDIRKHGDGSPFVLTAPQTFGLRELGAQPSADVPPLPSKPSPPNASRRPLSFTDAAEKVLEIFGDKSPMHYRTITQKAIQQSWIATEGKTPEATMYAQILTEIRRRQRQDNQPRFVRHGRGWVGLARWMGKGLAFDITQHNKQVRQTLRKRLLDLSPKEFEELIGLLLAEMGFEEVAVVGRAGDGGIDVRALLIVGNVVRIRMAIQAKKWKIGNNVQAPDVQRVRGSLGTHDQGLIITTSDFSPGACREAERSDAVPVALMNGEQLAILLAEYEIGVTRQPHEVLELEATDHALLADTDTRRAKSPKQGQE